MPNVVLLANVLCELTSSAAFGNIGSTHRAKATINNMVRSNLLFRSISWEARVCICIERSLCTPHVALGNCRRGKKSQR